MFHFLYILTDIIWDSFYITASFLLYHIYFALIISFYLRAFFIIPISPFAHAIYIYIFFNHISICIVFLYLSFSFSSSSYFPLNSIATNLHARKSERVCKPTILSVRSHNRVETDLFSLSLSLPRLPSLFSFNVG